MNCFHLPDPIARFSWRRWLIVRRWLERAWNPELEKAIYDGDIRGAVRALANGADPDAMLNGDPPVNHAEPALVMAARKNDAQMVQVLVHFGATLRARGTSLFQHDALATAILARKWCAAQALVDAGASWDTEVWVLDPSSLPSATTLSCAVDPGMVRTIKTTLEELVEGKTLSLRDATLSKVPVSEESVAQRLLARHRSVLARDALSAALPPPAVECSSVKGRL